MHLLTSEITNVELGATGQAEGYSFRPHGNQSMTPFPRPSPGGYHDKEGSSGLRLGEESRASRTFTFIYIHRRDGSSVKYWLPDHAFNQ